MRTLITGIGGTRSIAVKNALRAAHSDCYIVGSDANYFNAGSYECDAAYSVPFASDPTYLPKLEEIITSEKIDIIFATVEKEVVFLAKNKQYLEETHKLKVIVPDSEILDICFGKYRTQEFLRSNGFVAIPCTRAGSEEAVKAFVAETGLPLIRKPDFGYGSRGLSILRTAEDVAAMEYDDDYVLQRLITNDDVEKFYNTVLEEYTAEIFVNADKSIAGGIIIKRALHGGETVAGYLVKDQKVLDYLSTVARKLAITGPCNFQYRIENGKVYIFEINPLFSGTTAIRAGFGFNSVGMAADSFVNGKHGRIEQEQLEEKYFMRYLQEVFVSPENIAQLRDKGVFRHE